MSGHDTNTEEDDERRGGGGGVGGGGGGEQDDLVFAASVAELELGLPKSQTGDDSWHVLESPTPKRCFSSPRCTNTM